MQYFKPAGDFFLGDCMPFAHEGIFHLFYLWDEGHHKGLGGLGGHQWTHATTTDLIHWEHHHWIGMPS
jgi:beta-fructofuranosidase